MKDQLICHEADLRVREKPDLTGYVIGHLQKDKYYNYYDTAAANGYEWYKIADNQWIAKIASVEILPKQPELLTLAVGDLLEVAELTADSITFKKRKVKG